MIFTSIMMAAVITAADWASVQTPTRGSSEPIGFYAKGCIKGAKPADLKNPNYQVLRQQNLRYFGHPDLIDFLDHLGRRAHRQGLPRIQIGDMSMPRGGPFTVGHSSHQIGLDVDIWFAMEKYKLTPEELASPEPLDIVEPDMLSLNDGYSRDIYNLIKLAAEDERTERIFINPVIKERLCKDAGRKHRDWLRKVRPWWGHSHHMHVRLACPAGATKCEKQGPVYGDDGCGEDLEKWLAKVRKNAPKPDPKAKNSKKEKPKHERRIPKVIPPPLPIPDAKKLKPLNDMPDDCYKLLKIN